MTPTQQRLRDLRAACGDVWNRASMVEMVEHSHALSEAEVEAWKAGECCGRRSNGGSECLASLVCVRRHCALEERGMGSASVRAMRCICEHSEAYADIELAYRLAKDIAPGGVRLAEIVLAVDGVNRNGDG